MLKITNNSAGIIVTGVNKQAANYQNCGTKTITLVYERY